MAKSDNSKEARKRAYFVDVDGTLERKVLGMQMPAESSVQGLRELKREGALLYLWSVGGEAHAREAATKCGIESLFECFLPKPHVYIDDKPVKSWKDCERWKPGKLRKMGKAAKNASRSRGNGSAKDSASKRRGQPRR